MGFLTRYFISTPSTGDCVKKKRIKSARKQRTLAFKRFTIKLKENIALPLQNRQNTSSPREPLGICELKEF